MSHTDWTDDRVSDLKKLWSSGLSASEIAAELGTMTRNAVIGKINRLGLSGRLKYPRRSNEGQPRKPRIKAQTVHYPHNLRAAKARRSMPPKICDEPLAPPPPNAPDPMLYSVRQISDQTCRFPHGDPKTDHFGYCGHAPTNGTPYCEYHQRVMYKPSQWKDKEEKVA